MKRIIAISAAVLTALMATSCLDNSYGFIFSDMGMGTVKEGKILADNGLTYTVVEDNSNSGWTKYDRIMYYVLALNSTEENCYDVTMSDYAPVVVNDFKNVSNTENWEDVQNFPAMVNLAWQAGGHINLISYFPYVPNSQEKHSLDLYIDDMRDNPDTVFVLLRHTAGADADIEKYAGQYNLAYTYASFPEAAVLPEGRDSITLSLTYRWYDNDFDGNFKAPQRDVEVCQRIGKAKTE